MRVAPSAPDHTATDISMTFIAPKPATATALSRADEACPSGSPAVASTGVAGYPSAASVSSTGSGSASGLVRVTSTRRSVRLTRAATTSPRAARPRSIVAMHWPQRTEGTDSARRPRPSASTSTPARSSARLHPASRSPVSR